MYFSAGAIESAYRLLLQLDPKDEGKSRQEKVSALRHLLATSAMLKNLNSKSLDLSLENHPNREKFKKEVGKIVSIGETSRFTVDFAGKISEDNDYAVSSNFLTTRVKESRNGQNVPYPGRPKPVLDIINEKVTIRDGIKQILEDVYNLATIRAPLAVWLLRSENISPLNAANSDQLDELQKSITASIDLKFEISVANAIRPNKSELGNFISQTGLSLQNILDLSPASQETVTAIYGHSPGQQIQFRSEITGIVGACSTDLRTAGLKIHREMIHRFISSLLAKRFLILTGLSGSGKTKLAHAFASWICESENQYRLVAVGADWTTNENIVGYQDALQPSVYRKPSNGALDIIIRAYDELAASRNSGTPTRPYFLILDEMNLSHVERYFADILSAIESGQEIALHFGEERLKTSDSDPLLVPQKIYLPENLFIIGTVNVDETTYMFSPKVLDRANVLEFRASAEDILSFFDTPTKVDMGALEKKGIEFGQIFVVEAGSEVKLKGEIATALKEGLKEIFGKLADIGAEFGFRTAYEIARFIYFHEKLSDGTWKFEDSLDAQGIQKLMPKLHGSERKIGPVLEALDAFCEKNQCNKSREKIKRMQDRMKADGFTSFAEA